MRRSYFRFANLLVVLIGALSLAACTKNVKPAGPVVVPKNVASVKVNIAEADKAEFQQLNQHLSDGELLAAEELANGLLQKYPEYGALHVNMGVIALRQGELELALTRLDRGLALDPNNAHAFVFKAEVHAQQANYKSAAQFYREALARDPELPYAHYGLGVILDLYLFDFDAAEEHYQAFVESEHPSVKDDDRKKVKAWIRLLERKES